jgi:HPt (histidine-containing phosphotransfer) domain-containing protein
LHRLRSACGFCGAPALSAHALRLQRHVEAGAGMIDRAIERFRRALLETLAALDR